MFAAGDSLGPYTIVKPLGAGAMGEVYQARHRHMGRDAAIKVLRAELSEEADAVNRFFTEARATAAVRHPGIVEIFDCDIHRSGRAFIVMEFLAGEDLDHRLQRVRSFASDWPALRAIGRQLAGALGAAHDVGIVHRDLKPGNIFLVGDPPAVKIVDFGIAKLMNRGAAGHSLTQTGHILGTPLYMSPEQARGAKTIDHRTDIYALGCVLLEMITGDPPFVRKGAAEVLIAHLHDPAPRASSRVPSVPPALDDLVAAMLAKNPDDRPQSMADVAARLAEPAAPARAAVPAAASTAVGRAAGPSPTQPPPVQPQPAAPAVASTRAGFVGREAQQLGRAGDTTLGASAAELAAVTNDEAPPRPRRTGLIVAAAAVLAIGAGAAMFARSGHEPSTAAAPAPEAPPPAAAPPPPSAPAPSRIAFTSQPSGAAIWIADEPTPRASTPATIELPPGSLPTKIVLRAPGREPATLTLDPNDTSTRHVVLPPVAAVAAPPPPPAPRPRHRAKAQESEFKAIED